MLDAVIHALWKHIEQEYTHLTCQCTSISLSIVHIELNTYVARIELGPEEDQISILHSIYSKIHAADSSMPVVVNVLRYHDETKINLADPQLLDKIKAIIT